MSKRNIAYIKPEEPSFLRKIKEQVGYKEGPTIDTKRQGDGPVHPEDFEDSFDERPTVVVLKPGDLTAEEADVHLQSLEKEEEETKADLAAPIVFKIQKKKLAKLEQAVEGKSPSKKQKLSRKEKVKKRSLLSFDDEDEEEDC